MSFSATVKDELCRLELGKNCCMLSELAALYRTSGSLTFHGGGRVQVQYRVENTALARRIFRLLTARMAITPRLHYVQHARLGGRRTCVLTIGDEDSQRLMLALHLIDKDENGVVSYRRTIVRHHLTRQCCRRAYLRAAFLGAGTMTSPDKDYHFEITASEPGLVRELTRVLEKAELPVHTFQRKGQTVLYLKGAQQISDCLALMGASDSDGRPCWSPHIRWPRRVSRNTRRRLSRWLARRRSRQFVTPSLRIASPRIPCRRIW